jgi:hypothetical protein
MDELQIHQIPVLFGGGRRLFEVLPSRVELEIVRVIDTPEATHIRYRVRRRPRQATHGERALRQWALVGPRPDYTRMIVVERRVTRYWKP